MAFHKGFNKVCGLFVRQRHCDATAHKFSKVLQGGISPMYNHIAEINAANSKKQEVSEGQLKPLSVHS